MWWKLKIRTFWRSKVLVLVGQAPQVLQLLFFPTFLHTLDTGFVTFEGLVWIEACCRGDVWESDREECNFIWMMNKQYANWVHSFTSNQKQSERRCFLYVFATKGLIKNDIPFFFNPRTGSARNGSQHLTSYIRAIFLSDVLCRQMKLHSLNAFPKQCFSLIKRSIKYSLDKRTFRETQEFS